MVMQALRWFAAGMLAVGLTVSTTTTRYARAESWKPALHDADELADAAEDLHARAERLHDHQIAPTTASLEHWTRVLHQQMKACACAADIAPLLDTVSGLLNQTDALVHQSCLMQSDRKSLAELDEALCHFAEMSLHVDRILASNTHSHGPHNHSVRAAYGDGLSDFSYDSRSNDLPYYHRSGHGHGSTRLPAPAPIYVPHSGTHSQTHSGAHSGMRYAPQYAPQYGSHYAPQSSAYRGATVPVPLGKTLARALINEVLAR